MKKTDFLSFPIDQQNRKRIPTLQALHIFTFLLYFHKEYNGQPIFTEKLLESFHYQALPKSLIVPY